MLSCTLRQTIPHYEIDESNLVYTMQPTSRLKHQILIHILFSNPDMNIWQNKTKTIQDFGIRIKPHLQNSNIDRNEIIPAEFPENLHGYIVNQHAILVAFTLKCVILTHCKVSNALLKYGQTNLNTQQYIDIQTSARKMLVLHLRLFLGRQVAFLYLPIILKCFNLQPRPKPHGLLTTVFHHLISLDLKYSVLSLLSIENGKTQNIFKNDRNVQSNDIVFI